MNETGILSYEIGKLKVQELAQISERKRILNTGQVKMRKPVIQRVIQSLTGKYHIYGGT